MTETRTAPGDDLGDLYAGHAERIVAYVRHRLRDAGVPESYADAEDLVQDAFAQAYKCGRQIHSPRAYVYKIVKRRVADAVRCYRRREEAYATLGGEQPVSDCADTVIRRLTVRHAVHALPPQQRAAVWATQAMDQPQTEYAAAMGKAPGTVGVHVMRAVRVLKPVLAATVAAAAVALCALGTVGIHRYSAAGRAGQQTETRPEALDFLTTASTALGLALLGVAALSLTVVGVAHVIDRLQGPAPSGPSASKHCPSCSRFTDFRELTDAESRWLKRHLGGKSTVMYRKCSTHGCRSVIHMFDSTRSAWLPQAFQ